MIILFVLLMHFLFHFFRTGSWRRNHQIYSILITAATTMEGISTPNHRSMKKHLWLHHQGYLTLAVLRSATMVYNLWAKYIKFMLKIYRRRQVTDRWSRSSSAHISLLLQGRIFFISEWIFRFKANGSSSVISFGYTTLIWACMVFLLRVSNSLEPIIGWWGLIYIIKAVDFGAFSFILFFPSFWERITI